MSDGVTIEFVARAEPLRPSAVVAFGDCAERLARRVLSRGALSLRGVASPELLLFLGDEAELPWVPGVAYLGKDPQAPSLLLPTALTPNVPVALLARALALRLSGEIARGGPWALCAEPRRIVPLARALTVNAARLHDWLARCPAHDRAAAEPRQGTT